MDCSSLLPQPSGDWDADSVPNISFLVLASFPRSSARQMFGLAAAPSQLHFLVVGFGRTRKLALSHCEGYSFAA